MHMNVSRFDNPQFWNISHPVRLHELGYTTGLFGKVKIPKRLCLREAKKVGRFLVLVISFTVVANAFANLCESHHAARLRMVFAFSGGRRRGVVTIGSSQRF